MDSRENAPLLGLCSPYAKRTGEGPKPHPCLDQEGRRGTDEVMPGTSVFPSSETSVLGNS